MKNEQLKTSLARQLTKTIIIQRKNPDISLIEKEALSLVELYGQFSEEELKRYTIVTQYTYLTMPEYIGIKNRALLAWGTYYGMCFEVNHQLYKNRIKQQVKKTAKKNHQTLLMVTAKQARKQLSIANGISSCELLFLEKGLELGTQMFENENKPKTYSKIKKD